MKRIIGLAIILLACATAWYNLRQTETTTTSSTKGADTEAQKNTNGFLGFKWGTHISEFPDTLLDNFVVKSKQKTAERKLFFRQASVGKLGGVEMLGAILKFHFFEDKLFGVSGWIGVRNDSVENSFKDFLVSNYGEPTVTGKKRGLEPEYRGVSSTARFQSFTFYEWDQRKTYMYYRTGRRFYESETIRGYARLEAYSQNLYPIAMKFILADSQWKESQNKEWQRRKDSIRQQRIKDDP